MVTLHCLLDNRRIVFTEKSLRNNLMSHEHLQKFLVSLLSGKANFSSHHYDKLSSFPIQTGYLFNFDFIQPSILSFFQRLR
jgi:hypothetical protein